MMHAQTMVVDGLLNIFGSANFDNRSLELNDEVNVAVFSRRLAARFLQDFDHGLRASPPAPPRPAARSLQDFDNDLRASHKWTLATWRERPYSDRVHEYFWSFF